MDHDPSHPRWMTRVLQAAAIYNLLWGGLTVLHPAWLFELTGLAEPSYPFIWQCVGMIVGVYGVGYWIAAADPHRHWPIVLVGFLGKVLGPLGYLQGRLTGDVPAEFGWTLITNDAVWWIPFAAILWSAAKAAHAPAGEVEPLGSVLEETATSAGVSVAERSREQPVLLVMVRHAGCTFCKETLADLARARDRIESAGVRIVVGHMSDPPGGDRLLRDAGLEDVEHVSDPDRRLYRALDLDRGSLRQLFGPRVWLRGAVATLRGHTVGKLAGDGFQMPGAFLIRDARVIDAQRHESAADRPDYAELACGAGTALAGSSA